MTSVGWGCLVALVLRGVVGGLWRAKEHRTFDGQKLFTNGLLSQRRSHAFQLTQKTVCKKLLTVKSSVFLHFPLLSSLIMHLII